MNKLIFGMFLGTIAITSFASSASAGACGRGTQLRRTGQNMWQCEPVRQNHGGHRKSQHVDQSRQKTLTSTSAKVTPHSQCDPGWTFNGAVCTRESRPTLSQRATSFQVAKCTVGETRTVDHEVIENGIPIKRQVLQTCGAK